MKNQDGIPCREYCNVPKRCVNLKTKGNIAVSYVGKGPLPSGNTTDGCYCEKYPDELLDDRNPVMIIKCNSCKCKIAAPEKKK